MSEHKAVPVQPSALIQGGSRSFASMRDVTQLRTVMARAAMENPVHKLATQALGVMEDTSIPTMPGRPQTVKASSQPKITRGMKAADAKTGKMVTVIKASVGFTKKSKTPVHQVADSKGNAWLAKETDLIPRS